MKKMYSIVIIFMMIFSLINNVYSQTINCKQVYYSTDNTHVMYVENNTDSVNDRNHSGIFDWVVASVWTWNGEHGIMRSFLNFDLSNVFNASQTFINNAHLYLYNSHAIEAYHSKTSTTKPNKIVFHRVTSSWQESTVTWNTQPAISTASSVESPEFLGTTGVQPFNYNDLTINLNSILLNNGKLQSDYKGISFREYDDGLYTNYRQVNFVNNHHPNQNYWPKLEVEYTLPQPTINFDGNTFQVANNHDLETLFDNVVYQWDINGRVYYGDSIRPSFANHFDVILLITITNSIGNICSYKVDGTFGVNMPTISCKQVYYPTDNTHVMYVENNTDSVNDRNHSGIFDWVVASVWTWNGEHGMTRSFLNFDLSNVFNASQAFINNADLYLYNSHAIEAYHSKQSTSMPNKIVFHRVTSSWQENTITWNTQPAISTTSNVESPEFLGTTGVQPFNYDDLTINLNSILLNNGKLQSDFKGISFREYDDGLYTNYRQVNFVNNHHPDQSYWPKLEVGYTFPRPNISFDGYNTFRIVSNHDLETLFSNVVYQWNINGNTYYGNTVMVNLQQSNTIDLQIVIPNNVGDTCKYTIIASLNYLSDASGTSKEYIVNNILLENESAETSNVENRINGGYIIYPNPTEKMIQVKNNTNAQVKEFSIFNSIGVKVKGGAGSELHEIDVSELNSGLYIIKIIDDKNEKAVLSFIKK